MTASTRKRTSARRTSTTSAPPLAAAGVQLAPTSPPTGADAPSPARSGAPFPIATELEVIIETPWCDKPPRPDIVRAIIIYAGLRFYGIGTCTWSALREALQDYNDRGIEGRPFRPARTAS